VPWQMTEGGVEIWGEAWRDRIRVWAGKERGAATQGVGAGKEDREREGRHERCCRGKTSEGDWKGRAGGGMRRGWGVTQDPRELRDKGRGARLGEAGRG